LRPPWWHARPRAYFGALAHTIVDAREETSFDRGASRFAWLILRFILVMDPAVFLDQWPDQARLVPDAAHRRH
jgi:magnesium-transporting ATPase (P-type)